jgi:hypothetical protein
VDVATGLPKSGTPGTCGATSRRLYLDQLHGSEAPAIVIDPNAPDRAAVVATVHGEGADEADVVVSTSRDGGRTWSASVTLYPSAGGQFYPTAGVTPDGRVGVGYYQQVGADELNAAVSVFEPLAPGRFAAGYLGTGIMNAEPFPLGRFNPQFDSAYGPCFGLESLRFVAPGSGFAVAWTDMNDPGPAANGGVDPNVRFASFEGWSVATETTLRVTRGGDAIHVLGSVRPSPHAPAPVLVRLLADSGNGFVLVDRARPRLDLAGRFRVRVHGSGDATCRLVARFRGGDGRLPSSATATFVC